MSAAPQPINDAMLVNDWLERYNLSIYAAEITSSGAETLNDIIQCITSKEQLIEGAPSIATAPFHVTKFINALNKDGGNVRVSTPAPNLEDGERRGIETKFIKRIHASFGYIDLVSAGFIFPPSIFVIAFGCKGDCVLLVVSSSSRTCLLGILPVDGGLLLAIKNILWAACSIASKCLYLKASDFETLALILDALFPQMARMSTFRGFKPIMVEFWRNVRFGRVGTLQVPTEEGAIAFQVDPSQLPVALVVRHTFLSGIVGRIPWLAYG